MLLKSLIPFQTVVTDRQGNGGGVATPGAKTEIAPIWTGWECHDDPLTLQGTLPPSAEISLCFFSLSITTNTGISQAKRAKINQLEIMGKYASDRLMSRDKNLLSGSCFLALIYFPCGIILQDFSHEFATW